MAGAAGGGGAGLVAAGVEAGFVPAVAVVACGISDPDLLRERPIVVVVAAGVVAAGVVVAGVDAPFLGGWKRIEPPTGRESDGVAGAAAEGANAGPAAKEMAGAAPGAPPPKAGGVGAAPPPGVVARENANDGAAPEGTTAVPPAAGTIEVPPAPPGVVSEGGKRLLEFEEDDAAGPLCSRELRLQMRRQEARALAAVSLLLRE